MMSHLLLQSLKKALDQLRLLPCGLQTTLIEGCLERHHHQFGQPRLVTRQSCCAHPLCLCLHLSSQQVIPWLPDQYKIQTQPLSRLEPSPFLLHTSRLCSHARFESHTGYHACIMVLAIAAQMIVLPLDEPLLNAVQSSNGTASPEKVFQSKGQHFRFKLILIAQAPSHSH